MSESTAQSNICKAMKGIWDEHKHNDVVPGVPDLSFSLPGLDGWIEIKWAPLPVRPGSKVRVTKGGNSKSWAAQKIWMRKRASRGGACFVLLQVGRQHLLFWHDVAAALLDVVDMDGLEVGASYIWDGVPPGRQFEAALISLATQRRFHA